MLTVRVVGDQSCTRCGDKAPRGDGESWLVGSAGMFCSSNCWNHEQAKGLAHALALQVAAGFGHASEVQNNAENLIHQLRTLRPIRPNSCHKCGMTMSELGYHAPGVWRCPMGHEYRPV